MSDDTCIFRPAQREDLAAIVRLLADDPLGQARETVSEVLPAVYGTAFDAIAADPRQELIVAEAGGTVVGCLHLTIIPGLSWGGMTRAQIEDVRVASSLRRTGIGRQLMTHAVDRARRRGCGMMQLLVNKSRTDAERFYRQLGFDPGYTGMRLLLG